MEHWLQRVVYNTRFCYCCLSLCFVVVGFSLCVVVLFKCFFVLTFFVFISFSFLYFFLNLLLFIFLIVYIIYIYSLLVSQLVLITRQRSHNATAARGWHSNALPR